MSNFAFDGGAGGGGSSTLSFTDTNNATKSAIVTATDTAYGGDGGSSGDNFGTATTGLNGGAGGAGTSSLTLTGAATVSGTTNAFGGDGGSSQLGNASAGAGGTAKSIVTVQGVAVTSSANAIGGVPTGSDSSGLAASNGIAGSANAYATGTGVSGTTHAHAESDPGQGALLQSLTSSALGVVDGASGTNVSGVADAITAFASTPSYATNHQSLAFVTGLPVAKDVTTVLNNNSNIAAGFKNATSYFAIGELGGAYDTSGHASETDSQSIAMTIDPSQLNSPSHLLLGLYSGTVLGSGPTSVALTIQANGQTILSQSFTAATAKTYFTNDSLDLGSIGNLESNGLVNFSVTLSETFASAGSGFFGNLILADPPAATTASKPLPAMQSVADTAHPLAASAPIASSAFNPGLSSGPSASGGFTPRSGIGTMNPGDHQGMFANFGDRIHA